MTGIWSSDDGTSATTTVLPSTSTALVSSETSSTLSSPKSSTTPSPTTRQSSTSKTPTLKTASFSNAYLDQLTQSGRETYTSETLTQIALAESTNHENAVNLTVTTNLSPAQCSWSDGVLKFMQSGDCYLKVTIPSLKKSPKFKAFSQTIKIPVSKTSIASPDRFSAHYRISRVATARGNFLTYGAEVPVEMKLGDAKGYWHMRLSVALQQPGSAPGPAKCFRIYARYGHGKSSYNDFTDDIMGCAETTGSSGAKEYCVNFQPSWYTRTSSSQEALVLKDASGAIATDDFATIKYTYVGWGVEWGWDTFNTATAANRTWTTNEIQQAEHPDSRPVVNVLAVKAGKCP